MAKFSAPRVLRPVFTGRGRDLNRKKRVTLQWSKINTFWDRSMIFGVDHPICLYIHQLKGFFHGSVSFWDIKLFLSLLRLRFHLWKLVAKHRRPKISPFLRINISGSIGPNLTKFGVSHPLHLYFVQLKGFFYVAITFIDIKLFVSQVWFR